MPDQRPDGSDPVTSTDAERPGDVLESVGVVDVVRSEAPQRLAARTALVDVVSAAFDAHERELYAFALRATREGAAAEDLVQESFLRLVREVRAGRPPDNVRAWLFRVCANLTVSRGRRRTIAARYLPFLAPREIGETPEARHLRHELGDELVAAMAGLSADERAGLLLSAAGFHGQEIADLIGRSHGATRAMLTRARVKVQERLVREGDHGA